MNDENRQAIWDEYQGTKNGPMKRMFLEYNRYFEADTVFLAIRDVMEGTERNMDTLKVLDFGCGVADYGITFARRGDCFVRLLDIDPDALQFALWRFRRENLSVGITDTIGKYDVVIFGEVLDHLVHPLEAVRDAIKGGAEFIFTSSYPYRSDDPNDVHWKHDHHFKSAFDEQKPIRDLLEHNFDKMNFGGQRNLWVRKSVD